MSTLRFAGLDVHADTIAPAIAEPNGKVRRLGVIPNRSELIRKLVAKCRTDRESSAAPDSASVTVSDPSQPLEPAIHPESHRASPSAIDGPPVCGERERVDNAGRRGPGTDRHRASVRSEGQRLSETRRLRRIWK